MMDSSGMGLNVRNVTESLGVLNDNNRPVVIERELLAIKYLITWHLVDRHYSEFVFGHDMI